MPMEPWTLAEFEAASDEFDEVVARTPDIDGYCSSSDWILAAHAAWGDDAPPCVARGKQGYAAFVRHQTVGGPTVWAPFDTMWGFGCPLVGANPARIVSEFHRFCLDRIHEWSVVLVSGLREGSLLVRSIAEQFGGAFSLRRSQPDVRRWQASLEGGVEGYLARRSAKFREALRRSERLARGIEFEGGDEDDVGATFDRILEIERRSWKGPSATGLLTPEMERFYRGLAERLAPGGRLRALFARHRGADVGYILGAVRGRDYRGFQFSFDADFAACSLGNLLQIRQIERLQAEGCTSYDLGIDMDYKRRWADRALDTFSLAILNPWPGGSS